MCVMSVTSAIIGCGGMGEWHYHQITDNIPEIQLKGVYDIRPERLEQLRGAGVPVIGSLEEVLNDPAIELVTIATPNNFHAPLAIACMEAGKNVVCEKPVTMNAAELTEVIAAAERCGKVFTVHQNRRWDADFVTIQEIVRSNVIGKPYMIESRVQGSRRVLCGWRGYAENGGGMLLDWGVHLIDQLLWLVDSPVTQVYCQMFALMPGVVVDDNMKLLMRFENGLSALVEVSTNCFILQPRWHMSCEMGTAVIDDWAVNGKMVRLTNEDEMAWEESIVYTEAGPTRTMAPRPPETTETLALPAVKTDLRNFYRNVVKAIREGDELIVKPAEALRVMKVVDACFESQRTGAAVVCRI